MIHPVRSIPLTTVHSVCVVLGAGVMGSPTAWIAQALRHHSMDGRDSVWVSVPKTDAIGRASCCGRVGGLPALAGHHFTRVPTNSLSCRLWVPENRA